MEEKAESRMTNFIQADSLTIHSILIILVFVVRVFSRALDSNRVLQKQRIEVSSTGRSLTPFHYDVIYLSIGILATLAFVGETFYNIYLIHIRSSGKRRKKKRAPISSLNLPLQSIHNCRMKYEH
ncbi:unnamed protein product [Lepeophtheirus salmonis]|uniref:(salmon louse) hypothetical protein n=1 Tax=Lepeophtheirus salmonis TaxID=72036 RepID=A0A7R8CVR2_LEPSM|nr:unnamed protein product [Lepeophtheirus salmonis]CAF2947086.1 unnamed protein product [Lepeophtheirus salmonis]